MKSTGGRTERTTTTDDLRSIYRATLADVFGYLLMHTGGNLALAEDLTAETFLHATRHIHDGRGEEVTIAWLKTVARRRLVDHVRHEARLARRAARLGAELAVRPRSDLAQSVSDREEMYEVLASLTADQRLVLVLKHLDGLSVSEIAEQIGRSVDGTASLLSRARAAFRLAYVGDLDE